MPIADFNNPEHLKQLEEWMRSYRPENRFDGNDKFREVLAALLTSRVWRQDHNGFSHQDPGFIDHIANISSDIVRIYQAPDANCLLSVADYCLRSRNYLNLIIAGDAAPSGRVDASLSSYGDHREIGWGASQCGQMALRTSASRWPASSDGMACAALLVVFIGAIIGLPLAIIG